MTVEKKQRKLLIVDDEEGIREIVQDLASEITNNIVTASNGKEALEIVKLGGIDAIISDVSMPVMSGLEFLSSLRELGYETPFVILTGYGDSKCIAEALRLGATDFIDKPFNDEKLLQVLDYSLDLGTVMKQIDLEIQEICKNGNVSTEKFKALKNAKISLWLMKKSRESS